MWVLDFLWSSLLTCHVMTVFHIVIFEFLMFKNHCLLLGGESGPPARWSSHPSGGRTWGNLGPMVKRLASLSGLKSELLYLLDKT